ncbi:hypothetical protein [Moraxella atlantae]|uniref:Uncharacterized protein n=1 Tax=Faucicola atlantae TaxID=34059 RepID=A0A378Q3C1_9GAMM|nr:hypothetical protein [Moraxella atlantae]OPH33619.1 hypothetical protein B5J92_09450 [Moraxella atlantae]STY95192.1 Uncharacterised protein [Moraxella atlantae]
MSHRNYNHTEYAKRARANYNAKAIANVGVQFRQADQAALDALNALTEIYGSRANAVKQALLAHYATLQHTIPHDNPSID